MRSELKNVEKGENENGLEPIMETPPLEKIIKKEDVYEFYINDSQRNTDELMLKDNMKYNAFTFYQFIRLANIYFVFMTII